MVEIGEKVEPKRWEKKDGEVVEIWPAIPCVLVDLDGTLCDLTHRLHYIENKKKQDWETFYQLCCFDKPNKVIVEWLRAIRKAGWTRIFIVSGRRITTYNATERWLDEHNVPYDDMYMTRGLKDYRPDTEIKKEMLKQIYENGFFVEFVIDDRPTVVQMWRELGLKVYPVHQDRWEVEKSENQ